MDSPPQFLVKIPHYYRDGHFEGDIYPPEYYMYNNVDLQVGTWKQGVQAINEFDWFADDEEKQDGGYMVVDAQDGGKQTGQGVHEAMEAKLPTNAENPSANKENEVVETLSVQDTVTDKQVETEFGMLVETPSVQDTVTNEQGELDLVVLEPGLPQTTAEVPEEVVAGTEEADLLREDVLKDAALTERSDPRLTATTSDHAFAAEAGAESGHHGDVLEQLTSIPRQEEIQTASRATSSSCPFETATPQSAPWISSPTRKDSELQQAVYIEKSMADIAIDEPRESRPIETVAMNADADVIAYVKDEPHSPREDTTGLAVVEAPAQSGPADWQKDHSSPNDEDDSDDTIAQTAGSHPVVERELASRPETSQADSLCSTLSPAPTELLLSVPEQAPSPWAGDLLDEKLAHCIDLPALSYTNQCAPATLDSPSIMNPPLSSVTTLPKYLAGFPNPSTNYSSPRLKLSLNPPKASEPFENAEDPLKPHSRLNFHYFGLAAGASTTKGVSPQRELRKTHMSKSAVVAKFETDIKPAESSEPQYVSDFPAKKRQKMTPAGKVKIDETGSAATPRKRESSTSASATKAAQGKVEEEDTMMEPAEAKGSKADVDTATNPRQTTKDASSPLQRNAIHLALPKSPNSNTLGTPSLTTATTKACEKIKTTRHPLDLGYGKRHTRGDSRVESATNSNANNAATMEEETLVDKEEILAPIPKKPAPRKQTAASSRKRKHVLYDDDEYINEDGKDAEPVKAKPKVAKTTKTAKAKDMTTPATVNPTPDPRSLRTSTPVLFPGVLGSPMSSPTSMSTGTPTPASTPGPATGKPNKYGFKPTGLRKPATPRKLTAKKAAAAAPAPASDSSSVPIQAHSKAQRPETDGRAEANADTEKEETTAKAKKGSSSGKDRTPAKIFSGPTHITTQDKGKVAEAGKGRSKTKKGARMPLLPPKQAAAQEDAGKVEDVQEATETKSKGRKTAKAPVKNAEIVEIRQTRRASAAQEEIERARDVEKNIGKRTRSGGVKKL